MIYPPRILDVLQQLGPTRWDGIVFRHMFAGYPPERTNTGGARWNPPGVAAIYLSCERDTALAEAEHQLVSQPVRPRASRRLYRVKVSLSTALDLTERATLQRLGLDSTSLDALSFRESTAIRCSHVIRHEQYGLAGAACEGSVSRPPARRSQHVR